MGQKHMTHKQKAEKFDPVVNLLLASRAAYAARVKTEKSKDATDEQKAQAKAKSEAAGKAAAAAQASYTPDDVFLLIQQLNQRIYRDGVVPDGKGGERWDSWATSWEALALYDVIDDRSLPRDDKDKVANYAPLKIRHLQLHQAFIDACRTVRYFPRVKVVLVKDAGVKFVEYNDRSIRGKVIDTTYGLQEATVREVLNRLNEAVTKKLELGAAAEEMLVKTSLNAEANQLNKLAGELRRSVSNAGFGKWLSEKKPEPVDTEPEQVSEPEEVKLHPNISMGNTQPLTTTMGKEVVMEDGEETPAAKAAQAEPEPVAAGAPPAMPKDRGGKKQKPQGKQAKKRR
ncbi:MAG: hypothetical protein KGI60_03845 [Patescibacteria group bacterium]|nr:hypothetical protein [Patescibacteria group bacterium]